MTEQYSQQQKVNILDKGSNLSKTIKTGVTVLGSMGVLGSSLIWTGANATTDTLVIPDAPSAATETPKSAEPPSSVPAPAPVPQTVSAPEPALAEKKVKLSAPRISVTQPPVQQPQANFVKNSYIDQTNYNTGNPEPRIKPSTVVITERSTGCQTVVSGSAVAGGGCAMVSVKKPSVKTEGLAINSNSNSANNNTRQIRITRRDLNQVALVGHTKPYPVTRARHYSARTIQNAPNVVYSNSISTAPLNVNPPQYSRAPRQLVEQALQYGNTSLIFPLSIPASISSAFGWRIHPISGTQRMHSGTDLAAPMRTPVLAAYPGEVATAESLGGYGLTVILRHLDGSQESRYAHLSQIFVQPGQWVEQGAVIGLVGSTGFSTGPHLHFEWRHKTEQGWIAVDAGLHLQMAVENMIRALQSAQSQPNPYNDRG